MRRTILIVEDTQQCVSAIDIALLAISDVDLVHAANGHEALKFLASPDSESLCTLVTDLNMPQVDGFELIAAVRSASRHSRVPIVVLSGDTDPATPERTRRLGANAFFAKPYSPSQVRGKIEALLNDYTP